MKATTDQLSVHVVFINILSENLYYKIVLDFDFGTILGDLAPVVRCHRVLLGTFGQSIKFF